MEYQFRDGCRVGVSYRPRQKGPSERKPKRGQQKKTYSYEDLLLFLGNCGVLLLARDKCGWSPAH